MLAEGRAQQRIVQDGSDQEYRLTRHAAMAACDAHGRYYDAVTRGNVFFASTQAAVTFGTALTATAVTLTLFNPSGSGRNLVIIEASASVATITAAGQVVWAVNATQGQAAPTATTAATIRNALLGGGNGVGQVFTAATLPATPVVARTMFSVAATAATGLSPVMLIDEVAGRLILPPGMIATLQGITIAGSGVLGMMWEEVVP